MIDDAEALNSRKQNEGIGLVTAKDDEDESRLGERDDKRLEELIRSKKPARTSYEEENKESVENAEDLEALIQKRSNLSASHKIAEMGLGRAYSSPDKIKPSMTKAATGGNVASEEPGRHSNFNRILTEAAGAQDDGAADGSDSDDLF